MHYNITVLVPPTQQVVSPQFVRDNYARASNTADDALISNFVDVATELAEKYLNRVLLTQTLQLTLSRKTIPHMYGGAGLPWAGFGSQVFADFWSCGQQSLDLPYNPVQQILAVQRGHWSNPVDTLLVEGTDYYYDLMSAPARIKFINTTNPAYSEHLSIQYVAGYGFTNNITVTGSVTSAAGPLSATVGGVPVSVTIPAGTSAPTALASLYTAIQAAGGTPSASLLYPATIQLRGGNVAVTGITAPTGLTVEVGTPTSSIPAAITTAIAMMAASMYEDLSSPSNELPVWFTRTLSPFRLVVFG